MILANDPGRYDTEHSRMPAARARHNGCIMRGIELTVYLLYRCVEDLLLNLLPFAIFLVKFCRERRRIVFVTSEQKKQRFFRRAQTPRSIQSRAKPKTNVLWQNRWVHSRDLH